MWRTLIHLPRQRLAEGEAVAVSNIWRVNYHFEIAGKLVGSQKQMHVSAGITARSDGTAQPDVAGVRTSIGNNDPAPTGAILVLDNISASTTGFGLN
jgi:hypothetical protein